MIINYISKPSFYIGGCVVCWGITSALTGTTHSFGGILTCRLLIGLPEAAFYPGATYLLSRWYTRKELAFRSAIMFSALLFSIAFGNLFAAGILSSMEGTWGIRAWRWLFFLEGGVTIVVGLVSINLLPDFPHNTSWITGSQRRLAQVRLAEETGEADMDGHDDPLLLGVKLAARDPKVWIFAFLTLTQLWGLSFVHFFPTLTATLGYSTTTTLLLAAPPWLVSAVVCLANARHADKTGERYFHLAFWWWVIIVGYLIALSTTYTPILYLTLFLMACGNASYALTMAWVSNAIPRPPAKRAAAIGIVNGLGNVGNMIGAYTWRGEWAPRYRPSMLICIAALVMASLLGLAVRQILIQDNKRLEEEELKGLSHANRERVEAAARLEGITFEEAMERQKGFRYLY